MYEDFFFALRNWIFSTRRIFEQREFLKSSISWKFKRSHNGPTQVKCRLLISSNVMNFLYFLEMLEFNLWHF